MTARLLNEVAAPPRVISVSPHAHGATFDMGRVHQSDSGPQISPVVKALDDRLGSLRDLIMKATTVSGKIQFTLAQIHEGDSLANRASAHLQERLRLSARMVQAFQAQIARLENGLAAWERQQQAIDSLGAGLDQKLVEFESRARAVTERFADSMNEIAATAMAKFEQRVVDRAVARDEVMELSNTMREIMQRIDRITAIDQRRVEASGDLRREAEETTMTLEIGKRRKTTAAGDEPPPPLRLKSWAGGG